MEGIHKKMIKPAQNNPLKSKILGREITKKEYLKLKDALKVLSNAKKSLKFNDTEVCTIHKAANNTAHSTMV